MIKHSLGSLIVTVLLLSSGCHAQQGATIWQGSQARVTQPMTIIARGQAEWESLWQQAGRDAPMPDLPDGKIAVAVMAGQKRSGGYEVEIANIADGADAVSIDYRLREPPPFTMVTQALTSPYAVALIDKTDKTIQFRAVK